MGFVFDFNAAVAYDTRCREPAIRSVIDREVALMRRMLSPLRGRHFLDIGCATGIGLTAMRDDGLECTGLDASPYMLDMARERLGHRAALHHATAEALPFEDNTFHYASLSKTLAFVEDPEKALAEAFRVTRERVFIGLITRHGLPTERSRRQDPLAPFHKEARCINFWKLKRMIRVLAGEVPITWQSPWPATPPPHLTRRLMHVPPLNKIPIGTHIGIVVTLHPRFRTRPLAMACTAKQRSSPLFG